MKRVSVIGCPGSGKTTFCRELSRSTQLPLVHLDLMYYDQSYPYATEKSIWQARVLSEAKKKQWIIDGNYKSTFDIRLPKSDTIIFLDYPTYVSMWRAIKRRVQFRKKIREDMPLTWKEHLGWNFLVFILRFNQYIAPDIRLALKLYADKDVVTLKSPRHARMYLANIKSSSKT